MFYLLWGAAALHPSMRHLADRAPDQETRLTRARLILLGAASLILRLFGPSSCSARKRPTCGSPSISTTFLFVLVVARMAGLVRRQEQSTLREKALRNVGASLVTATNRESIYAATLQAARALVGDEAGLLLVATEADHPDIFQVVAASGGAERIEGTTVSLSILPRKSAIDSSPITRTRSRSKRPSWRAHSACRRLAFVLNAPLFMKEDQGLPWWPDRRASRVRSGTP